MNKASEINTMENDNRKITPEEEDLISSGRGEPAKDNSILNQGICSYCSNGQVKATSEPGKLGFQLFKCSNCNKEFIKASGLWFVM